MSEALAECEWIRGMFDEKIDPAFVLDEWRQRSRKHGLLAAGRTRERGHQLAEFLSVCDAKSLRDHLNSKTAGRPADRRTASEIQVVRASL
eukprot:10478782-Alexandrium_andersonii.AAC.1